ncbi:MAG: hypothetical protein ABIJ61_04375 [bacterium]
MKATESLKSIERRAYRSTFKDGVYDIAMGLVFLILAWIPTLESLGVSRFLAYALLIVPAGFALAAKRSLAVLRLGVVEFGPRRKTRRLWYLAIGGVVLILTLPLMIMIAARGIPAERLWLMIAAFAAPLVAIAVLALEFPRFFLYIALLFAGVVEAEFLLEYLGAPLNSIVSFGVPGLAILLIGISLLVKFLRDYPKQTGEATDVVQ